MPRRMFSAEGWRGLRSWRYEDGTASFRAVVAANSSTADGVPSALKPRRTTVSPYPTTAIATANRISETTFQGFELLTSGVEHDLLVCAGTDRGPLNVSDDAVVVSVGGWNYRDRDAWC